MSYETLIIILFFVTNFLTAIVMGLLDSRDFWKKKYEEVINEKNNLHIR